MSHSKYIESVFTPTGMWQSTKEKEYAAFEEGVKYGGQHWKTNHDKVVIENRRLKTLIHKLETAIAASNQS